MSLKLFLAGGVLVLGAPFVYASEKEMKVVEKNCWIEVFDDSEYDADDPHVTIQGPAEFATLKDVNGRDWSNDIESVIVGPSATVHAFKEKDFRGPEIAFTPGQRVPKLSKLDMSNTIESMKITCAP
jgi:hypothetical protein